MCISDTDDCVGHSCANGALCVDHLDSYTCDCADGYEGTLCDTGTYIIGTLMIHFIAFRYRIHSVMSSHY